MDNLLELRQFLVEAKKATYAAGDRAEKVHEEDHSTTLVYEEWDWKYHDNYFWGEPYGGREVVFHNGKPLYIMTYYGFVENTASTKEVYSVLQQALSNIPENAPYRWPKSHVSGDYEYTNEYFGKVERFYGEESISHRWVLVYKAKYIGWLVDLSN